jgi:cellulose synthase/poly-beta-1,6-N-acetylglucosamine synthase-like glycosyltransferase
MRRAEVGEWIKGGLSQAIFRRVRQRAAAAPPAACPELECVSGLLPRRVILAAERRARAIGLGADRVLLGADAITEDAYLNALAASIGTAYEPLENVARADCPLNDRQLIQAAAAGMLPLRRGNTLTWVIAPRSLAARRFAGSGRSRMQWLRPFRLTSTDRLKRFVLRHTERALGRQATDTLHLTRPLFSNKPRARGAWRLAIVALAALATAVLPFAPAVVAATLTVTLCAVFVAAALLRLATVGFARAPENPTRHRDDRELPIYTVICALYREANVVADLVAAIRMLDYPSEKLDVKFVLEADDHDTRRALARLDLGLPFDIITAPPIGPRTKPKALNVALAFAHGSYTVIYDAEDLPEPDQLRRALDAFAAAGDRVGCVQAALTIDNTADNWLTAMFTADYAGQFDVFLPALAAMRLPLPLGGTSNHFRTAVLRQIGGWDPYNVTEDADLGMRLRRLGYRSTTLSSATYEEAPARFVPWLKQRTRWYKGWMQTWLVHMRRPLRLLRELGPAGTIVFQLLFAGNVLSALVHPVFAAGFCYALFASPTFSTAAFAHSIAPAFFAVLMCGYAATIVPNAVGLWRRGLFAHAWVLVLAPLYWLLLSLAAWRALFQLIYDPQRWEKTEHGLARTSRLSAADDA